MSAAREIAKQWFVDRMDGITWDFFHYIKNGEKHKYPPAQVKEINTEIGKLKDQVTAGAFLDEIIVELEVLAAVCSERPKTLELLALLKGLKK